MTRIDTASSCACRAVGERGFSLIEVLVAVLVLSIGLLGVASLQVASLKSIKIADLNSKAALQAYDIVDRMKANAIAVDDGVYESATPQRVAGCTAKAGCTTSEMAANDLFEWNDLNSKRLPDGEGIVCIDSTPDDGERTNTKCDGAGDGYAIKLWWVNEDGKDDRYVLSYQP